MHLVNPNADYHSHSLNFSDGANTIDEIAQFVGRKELGLKELAITDHVHVDPKFPQRTARDIIYRWKNFYNDVNIIFGLEADLLNGQGDICDKIQNTSSDFLILSAHPTYNDDPKNITQGYINAIKRNHERIKCIGHLDAVYFKDHVDIERVVEEANKYHIPLEFNGTGFVKGSLHEPNTKRMLANAQSIMVNSDAHCLADFANRQKAIDYLKENHYL